MPPWEKINPPHGAPRGAQWVKGPTHAFGSGHDLTGHELLSLPFTALKQEEPKGFRLCVMFAFACVLFSVIKRVAFVIRKFGGTTKKEKNLYNQGEDVNWMKTWVASGTVRALWRRADAGSVPRDTPLPCCPHHPHTDTSSFLTARCCHPEANDGHHFNPDLRGRPLQLQCSGFIF